MNLRDHGGAEIMNLELTRCRFENCILSATRVVRKRSVVRNVMLNNCHESGSYIGTAILDEVVIDGLRSERPLQVWGAVYKHVVLKGEFDRLMLSSVIAPSTANWAEQGAFDEAATEFYAGVDWALDISKAEFKQVDVRGIPAALVRRDPETQAIVRRVNIVDDRWRTLDLSKTYWHVVIDLMLQDGRQDALLIAPKRDGKRLADLLEGIKRLRDAGIADPE